MPSARFTSLVSLLVIFMGTETQAIAAHDGQCQISDVNPKMIYKPPISGRPSPGIVVGGGTRTLEESAIDGLGIEHANLSIALAPEQIGLSSNAEPTFFWWSRQPSNAILKIGTISGTTTTQFEVSHSSYDSYLIHCLGISQLPLSDQGFQLKKNVEYRWTLTLVGNRPNIKPASGRVLYKEPSPEIIEKLGHADLLEQAQIYDNEGYWYDAIENLWRWIELHPENSQKQRKLLVDLLDKAGVELPGFKELMLAPDTEKRNAVNGKGSLSTVP